MSEASSRRRVCVVGGGASGLLTAIHVVREAGAAGRSVHVDVIEERPVLGAGVAYSTTDLRHLLNVPAKGMSALPDDPDHFLRWAVRKGYARGPLDFAPRAAYGSYLRRTLAEVESAHASVHAINGRAVRLAPGDAGVDVHLDDGRRVVADEVVLATGSPKPTDPMPSHRLGDRYVVDPWAPGALSRTHGWRKVLVLGTGLSMVDLALVLGDRRDCHIQALSRRGLLPRAHRPELTPIALTPPEPATLDELVGWMSGELDRVAAAGGDWRQVVDGLRPHTQRLWGALSVEDRGRFLRENARAWDVRRHRMAPPVAAAIAALRKAGRLAVAQGRLLDARVVDDRVIVRYLPEPGAGAPPAVPFVVDGVINATGPGETWADDNPLVRALREDGFADVDRWGLGLETGPDGAVAGPRVADLGAPLWSVGPLRRAAEWECTAVPDIRVQAQALAREIVRRAPAGVTAGTVASAPRDLFGLALTTSAEAADRYVVGLTRLLTLDRDGHRAIGEAVALDPHFALGQGVLALLAYEEGQPPWVVQRRLSAAARHLGTATERERSFVGVVIERCAGRPIATPLSDHVARWPRDGLALSMVLPTIAFSSDDASTDDIWPLLDQVAPAYGQDDWFVDGLRAFAHAEARQWSEAEELATSALAREPRAGHAAHALAHVFYETGRHRAGISWLDGWLAGPGGQQRFGSHFVWHAALCELHDGDRSALGARFDQAVRGADGVRVLIDAASLFSRCSVHGLDLGADRLEQLGIRVPASVIAEPGSPFVAWHVAVLHGLLADGVGLESLRAQALTHGEQSGWLGVAGLAEALLARLRGRHAESVRLFAEVLPRSRAMGGSPAQRELLEDLFVRACVEGDLADQARQVLGARLDRRVSAVDTRLLGRLGRPA